MLVRDALAFANTELDNFPSKQLEARILLASILNLPQELLLIRYNEEISETNKLTFLAYLQRRKSFEPIAYITGKKEFYGLDFLVNKNVLIPRPDTEILVDEVIKACPQSAPKPIKILDLGTGSGAIAVSLAVNIANAEIVATDISSEALKIAKQNTEINKVADKIKFIESNWYLNIAVEKFDFIISNPPYISVDEKIYMAEETLKYEPNHALFADNSGLENYNKIIKDASKFLKNEGKIFLEIGFNQASSVASILEKHQFTEIKVLKDLSGHTRVIIATYMC